MKGTMPALVISLDFELFWGVAASRSLARYRQHVEGEWDAIPAMLALFERHRIEATWATVGMVMCRDHAHWRALRPTLVPTYANPACSTYALDTLAREHPRLFFGRELVERILMTPGQELASHTYSHFYCAEEGVTLPQFEADLTCAHEVAKELGVRCASLVFPRNQVVPAFLPALHAAGIRIYRGNSRHWLYRDGHRVPGGLAGRAVRLADAWLPLSGNQIVHTDVDDGLVNVPASLFVRPWLRRGAVLEGLRLRRMKAAMTAAARAGAMCHLWWHPHNFGTDTTRNLAVLSELLQHFELLRDLYGMQSLSMRACAQTHPAQRANPMAPPCQRPASGATP